MNTKEFCDFASGKMVNDFVEAKIITEDEAGGVRFVIAGAMEAAAQHALIKFRASLAAAISDDSAPDTTEDDLVAFISAMHPHN